MSEPHDNLIQFHSGIPELRDPHPYRAAGSIPEWLKDMPPDVEIPGGGKINTAKVCMPFVDAMGAGYIIPLRATVHFFMPEPDKLEYEHPEWEAHGKAVTYQPAPGYRGASFEKSLVVKFINHWIVKTPPGYSSLFLPIVNQDLLPFQLLIGMVDTDTYYRPVFFPAICRITPGTRCTLERGSPLVQVIPIKRDSWRAEIAAWDITEHDRAEARALKNVHHYRDEHRAKKDYR